MPCDPPRQGFTVHKFPLCLVIDSLNVNRLLLFFIIVADETRHSCLCSLMMTTSPDVVKYCLGDIKYLRSHNKTNDDPSEGLIFGA